MRYADGPGWLSSSPPATSRGTCTRPGSPTPTRSSAPAAGSAYQLPALADRALGAVFPRCLLGRHSARSTSSEALRSYSVRQGRRGAWRYQLQAFALRRTNDLPPIDEQTPYGGRPPLAEHDADVRNWIAQAGDLIDGPAVTAAWDDALSGPPWDGTYTWIHSDLVPPSLLVRDGRLRACHRLRRHGSRRPRHRPQPRMERLRPGRPPSLPRPARPGRRYLAPGPRHRDHPGCGPAWLTTDVPLPREESWPAQRPAMDRCGPAKPPESRTPSRIRVRLWDLARTAATSPPRCGHQNVI
jgi:hypothetical protein